MIYSLATTNLTIIDNDGLLQLFSDANKIIGDILHASHDCGLDELSLLALEFAQKVSKAVREVAKKWNFQARDLCRAAAKTVHYARVWMEHTFCLEFEFDFESSIKAYQQAEKEVLRVVMPDKYRTYWAQHRLLRLKGYCNYPMKMTMQKSYFECLDLLTKRMDAAKTSLHGFFNCNDDAFIDNMLIKVYDIVECVQQEVWLVVTSEPSNVYGKKALSDSRPFHHFISAIRFGLKVLSKTYVNPTVLVGEFYRTLGLVKKLCTRCDELSKRLQKSNRYLSSFLNDVSSQLTQQVNQMTDCLAKWNGEEWSRGPFLELTVKMNNQLGSLEDILKSPEFTFKCPLLTAHSIEYIDQITEPTRILIDAMIVFIAVPEQREEHFVRITDQMTMLEQILRDKAPGQRRCNKAQGQVEMCKKRLEVAVEKIKCGYEPIDNAPRGCLRDHLNHVTTLMGDFDTNINTLAEAAIDNPSVLGYKALALAKNVELMTRHILNASTKTRKVSKQNRLLVALMELTERVEDFLEGQCIDLFPFFVTF